MGNPCLCLYPLIPIPGYEEYFIHPSTGIVVNRHNKALKSFHTKRGIMVELRRNGQREKILVQDLLERLKET